MQNIKSILQIDKRSPTLLRLLPVMGITASFLFLIVVFGLGFLEPGYSPVKNVMSILGGVRGIRGAIFNIAIVLTGIMLVAFAVGVHLFIGKGSVIGPVFIALGGIGLIFSAVFHCNQGCVNILKAPDFQGVIHSISSFIAGFSLAFSPIVIFPRLKTNPDFKNFARFTLTMGILANIPGLVFWVSFFTTRVLNFEGLIQRLGILIPLIWIVVMAIQQIRLSHRRSQDIRVSQNVD